VRPRPAVAAGTLWAGGLAAAAVAGMVAVVGVVIAHEIFGVEVLVPRRDGSVGDATAWGLAAAAALGALLATALMHVLLRTTPRPFAFFGWIVGLATAVATLMPFAADAAPGAKVVTAAINLVIGIAIGSLVRSVAARSLTRSAR
jgi:hypothetical protein